MDYIEGFVAAVSTKNKDLYVKHARDAGIAFKEHGAAGLV
jgi:uncharacterized protein YbaA (DUF1428 family)